MTAGSVGSGGVRQSSEGHYVPKQECCSANMPRITALLLDCNNAAESPLVDALLPLLLLLPAAAAAHLGVVGDYDVTLAGLDADTTACRAWGRQRWRAESRHRAGTTLDRATSVTHASWGFSSFWLQQAVGWQGR